MYAEDACSTNGLMQHDFDYNTPTLGCGCGEYLCKIEVSEEWTSGQEESESPHELRFRWSAFCLLCSAFWMFVLLLLDID